MGISKHFDKKNLHHAYLIEGVYEEVFPEISAFLETLGVQLSANPDFYHTHIDNFKIDEALMLRTMSGEKGYTNGKKAFVISANHFSLDAEQALLKMFEEPIENTHFFLITPDANSLLRTLVSRFYFIPSERQADTKEAESFIAMNQNARINFLKEFLQDDEDEDLVATDSVRSKSLRFLNDVEMVLSQKFLKNLSKGDYFEQIFKVRKFLRQPGSSTKSLMESLALVIPVMLQ